MLKIHVHLVVRNLGTGPYTFQQQTLRQTKEHDELKAYYTRLDVIH